MPTYSANASWPVPADIAERTAAAWNEAILAADSERRQDASGAVVDVVYPLGFAAGRRGGVEAVAQHISTAARAASTRLNDDTDPGRVVRGLLTQLTTAARTEVRRCHEPGPEDAANRPRRRTHAAASSDLRAGTDAQRAAVAANVAWSHGLQDGWRQAYWAANRIVNSIRNSEISATSAVDEIPAFAWLDDLADSARAVADERPGRHPVRLARLAGSSEPPPSAAADRGASEDAPSAAQMPRSDGPDKGDRRPRGM
ncbi:hypothetical protein ACI2K4_29440 [Micromonospora sp. NPDC050397]|uniref:hypothetical protein n=1 Tax=Micromonospora sp. NPDC050397 TaxID=3364279 RepID=UPI00384CAFF6